MLKKIAALLLSGVMMATALPAPAFAMSAEEVQTEAALLAGDDETEVFPIEEYNSDTAYALRRPVIKELSQTDEGIYMNWDEVLDAAGYVIYRDRKIVGEVEAPACEFCDQEELKNNVSYHYELAAKFETESGTVYSELEEGDEDGWITYLAKPVITSAKNTTAGIVLTWEAQSDISYCEILRNGESVDWIVDPAQTTWTDTESLANGTLYTYQIRMTANDVEESESPLSDAVKICRVDTPTISSVKNLSTGVKVTWTKVAGATGYYLYRNGKKLKTLSGASSVTFTDKTAANGTKYKYQVIAAIKKSSVLYKSEASPVKAAYYLQRGVVKSLVNKATKKMVVKWQKNAEAAGYQIKIVTGSKTVYKKYGSSTVSKTFSVTKGKTYKVYVRSYRKVSGVTYSSAWSAVKSVKITK